MVLAPWRSPLARALHRNRSLVYARYLQLATVRADGRPANRTVVFRGFLNDTNQLKFVTDRRSDKVAQLETQPWVEACWYFPKTREQFRLCGIGTIIQADHPDTKLSEAHQTQWESLSDAARLQFAWSFPGKPRDPGDRFDAEHPDVEQPLPDFCLLLLDPHFVDHLDLRGEPQNRCQYERCSTAGDASWTVTEVNP
jgi:pyridoxamine 5'-phosphate oxidase